MASIPLRKKDGSVTAYAIVDDDDLAWLSRWRWCLIKGGARRGTKRLGVYTHISMHRQIMGFPPFLIDHINGNYLDNRRGNLRECPNGQRDNQQNRTKLEVRNTSGYRGVGLHSATGLWRARATVDGREHCVGYFATPEQADAVIRAWRADHMPFSEDARSGA